MQKTTVWQRTDSKISLDEWDAHVERFNTASVFQCAAWGEYKKHDGWVPERWLAKDGDLTVSAAQVLIRRFPGIGCLAWIPGGPIFKETLLKKSGLQPLIHGLLESLGKSHGRRLYVRCYVTRPASEDVTFLLSASLEKALFPINSGFSYRVALEKDPQQRLVKMSKKHRYYTRKALAESIQWNEEPGEEGIARFCRLHRRMSIRKKMPELMVTPEAIATLKACFGSQASIFTGSFKEEVITGCIVLNLRSEAFYFLAATDDTGRSMNAAYGLVYYLMGRLAEQNIPTLDLGGIHPRAAGGVNHFKKGFGGSLIQYAGEWDWAMSTWYRIVINGLIALKERHR